MKHKEKRDLHRSGKSDEPLEDKKIKSKETDKNPPKSTSIDQKNNKSK